MNAEIFTMEILINQLLAHTLLHIGRRVCPAYGAVMHYENRKEPQYFTIVKHCQKRFGKHGNSRLEAEEDNWVSN